MSFLFSVYYLGIYFLSLQADQKLSYALTHCNPHREANIRFVSVMLAAYILHLHPTENGNLGWGWGGGGLVCSVARNVGRLTMTGGYYSSDI